MRLHSLPRGLRSGSCVVNVKKGEKRPISPSVCNARLRVFILWSKKNLLQLNFLLGFSWFNLKNECYGVGRTGLESLILPHAGCVPWGHSESWYLLCNIPASHRGGRDPTGGHLDRWPSIRCLVHGCTLRCFSRVPVDCGPSGSSVPGILQGRILEWVAMPSSRGSSQPRDQPCTSYVSCVGRRVLYH